MILMKLSGLASFLIKSYSYLEPFWVLIKSDKSYKWGISYSPTWLASQDLSLQLISTLESCFYGFLCYPGMGLLNTEFDDWLRVEV